MVAVAVMQVAMMVLCDGCGGGGGDNGCDDGDYDVMAAPSHNFLFSD